MAGLGSPEEGGSGLPPTSTGDLEEFFVLMPTRGEDSAHICYDHNLFAILIYFLETIPKIRITNQICTLNVVQISISSPLFSIPMHLKNQANEIFLKKAASHLWGQGGEVQPGGRGPPMWTPENSENQSTSLFSPQSEMGLGFCIRITYGLAQKIGRITYPLPWETVT